jgi:hypothetical protein
MIYMMQQVAPGPYKTAHYTFATAFMGLNMISSKPLITTKTSHRSKPFYGSHF